MRLHRQQRGQALVETALLTPLLILLILGAYDASIMASNKVQGTTAVRNGVRLASELGGVPNNPAPPASHTCDGTITSPGNLSVVDKQVVATVVASTANMSYVTISHIDVYKPSSADGSYNSPDPINEYKPDGTQFGPPLTFPLNQRCQGPVGSTPKDVSIGVRMVYTYTATQGLGLGRGPVNFPMADWSVEKMAVCVSNCL